MADRDDRPSGWRLLAAFVLAPIAPALLASAIFPAYGGLTDLWTRIVLTFPWALIFFGYLPTLFVGLPAYAFLRWKLRPTLRNCAITGALVAALPFGLLALLSPADQASIGGRATIIDGHRTWFGYLEVLKMIGMLAGFGALGGAAFGLVLMGPPDRRSAAAET